MCLVCLVYVFNVVNHFYYNSVFHAAISSLKYKADIVVSKIKMVKQDTVKVQCYSQSRYYEMLNYCLKYPDV